MKRKVWLILIISLILVTIAAIYLGSPNSAFKKASQTKQINKMAQYLNDKYGYDVSADDCIYFREQDYGHHIKLIYKVKYDIPYIAIFENNGERITVTDRQGFLGDDGQLDEVSGLITEYFERLTDLPIEYVELKSKFRNDTLINEILHHEYNEKLTEKNIGQFVEHMANRYDTVNALLYFKAEENLQSQLEKITSKLKSIDELGLDGSIRFYITDMDELHVQYNAPMVHLLSESSAKSQSACRLHGAKRKRYVRAHDGEIFLCGGDWSGTLDDLHGTGDVFEGCGECARHLCRCVDLCTPEYGGCLGNHHHRRVRCQYRGCGGKCSFRAGKLEKTVSEINI